MESVPKYPIRVVAARTGLRPATLRAWERRYGFPRPARTPSRYRLYSDEDIRWVRWVAERVEEGIPPRQATRIALERRASSLSPDGERSPQSLCADLVVACLAFDDERARALLRRAEDVLPPGRVVREVLLPAVAAVGAEWEAGRATVVCAAAPGERHHLGLMGAAVELRARGARIVYLGPDVPIDELAGTALQVGADAVLIGVVMPESAAACVPGRTHLRALRRSGVYVVWGGPAAPHVRRLRLPGTVAVGVDEAVSAVLTGRPDPATARTSAVTPSARPDPVRDLKPSTRA